MTYCIDPIEENVQVTNLKATRLHDCDTLHPQKHVLQGVYAFGKQIQESKYPDTHFKKFDK